MSILGDLAVRATGSWLKSLAVPALLIGTVTMGHQMIQARAVARAAHDASLVARGRQECISEVRLAQAVAERDAAQQRVRAAQSEARAAEAVTAEVNITVGELRNELDQARNALAGGDPRCLSDGVWQSLQGDAGRRR